MQKLIIPQKIKVGYQNREDTYTKKLAYVIYYDSKGVLRKEKSWESWRDKKIAPDEYENIPTEGFVLNKKVGGYKSGWDVRNTYVRVYDPRGFEFEISVPNLLYILTQCTCDKGKGLEGKFVYSWDGTELVLLPAECEDFKNSMNFTNLQTKKVSSKELIPGALYRTKQQEIIIYVGRFLKHEIQHLAAKEDDSSVKQPKQKYVFWCDKEREFLFFNDLKHIAELHSDVIDPDYAKLVVKYNKSINGSKPVKLFTKPGKPVKNKKFWWAYEKSPGCYWLFYNIHEINHYRGQWLDGKLLEIRSYYIYTIQDGVLIAKEHFKNAFVNPDVQRKEKEREREKYNLYNRFDNTGGLKENSIIEYFEPTNQELWVELESGSSYNLSKQQIY